MHDVNMSTVLPRIQQMLHYERYPRRRLTPSHCGGCYGGDQVPFSVYQIIMSQDIEGGIVQQEETTASLTLDSKNDSASSSLLTTPTQVRNGSGTANEDLTEDDDDAAASLLLRRNRSEDEDLCLDTSAGRQSSRPNSLNGSWRSHRSAHNVISNILIQNQDEFRLRKEMMTDLPRLVDRNLAFGQSSNKVNLRHNQGWKIYRLLRFNWFHVFLRWPTKYSFGLLMTIWTVFILIFAWVYIYFDQLNPGIHCGLGGVDGEAINFAAAFAFSLETCTTVGTYHTSPPLKVGNSISKCVVFCWARR